MIGAAELTLYRTGSFSMALLDTLHGLTVLLRF